MAAEAPTIADIEEFYQQQKKECEPLHKQIEELREVRYLRHTPNIPEAYKKTTTVMRSSIPFTSTQATVSTLSNNPFTVHCVPSSISVEAQEKAEKKERVLEEIFAQAQREGQRPTFKMCMDAAVGDGIAWPKWIYKPDLWTNITEQARAGAREDESPTEYVERIRGMKRGAKLPFVWRDADPVSIYHYEDDSGLSHVLEVTKHPRLPMKQKVKTERGWKQFEGMGKGRSLTDAISGDVEMRQLWTRTHVAYQIEDFYKAIPHKYKRVPYFPHGGYMTSSRDPKTQYLSILYPQLDLARGLDAFLTIRQQYEFARGFPRLAVFVKSTGTPASAQRTAEIAAAWSAGDVLPLGVDEEIRFIVPEESSGLNDMIKLYTDLLLQAAPDQVLYGKVKEGTSGVQLHLQITQARLALDPISQGAEESLTQQAIFLQYLIEKVLKESVIVYANVSKDEKKIEKKWLELGKDDIAGFTACQVSIQQVLPPTRITDGEFGAMLLDRGVISEEEFLETYCYYNQPREILKKAKLSRIMNSEPFMSQLTQDLMQEAGMVPPATSAVPTAAPTIEGSTAGMGMPEVAPGIAVQASDLAQMVEPPAVGTGVPGGAAALGMMP